MEFSPRLRQILLIMLEMEGVVSVKQLADEINVSKRTVQRELEYLESSLKKYHVSLKSKPGAGIWLAGTVDALNALHESLLEQDVMDSGNKEKRRKSLMLEMLKDRSPKKLYYYGNLFHVSEATISNDMEVIKNWFEKFHLEIKRKPGYGVSLEGSEKSYRLAVREFLSENIDSDTIRDMFLKKQLTVFDILGSRQEKNIYSLLNNEILEQVVTCLLSIKDSRIARLTENSYIGLIIHITIAVDRILKNEIIEDNQDILEKIIKDEDYLLALHIAGSLEEQFQIEIPDMEIAYIYLHIKGSKHQQIELSDDDEFEGENRGEMRTLINQMIMAYDETIAFELRQDEEFLVGLAAHLEPTIIRFKNNMMIANPLLPQIKESYPDIFEKCKKVGILLEERFQIKVPDAEIGFLVLHFGAALVRLKSHKENLRKVRIGIVCASGIGISRLMLTKLKYFVKDRGELFAYGKVDISPEELARLDFLISSIPLEEIAADVLMISPLLTDSDLERISSKISEYARTPKKIGEEDDFTKQLKIVNLLSEKIRNLIQDFSLLKVPEDIVFEDLVETVSAQITTTIADQQLVAADILRREQLGSQVIPQFGFALLHARSKGVDKPWFITCVTEGRDAFKNSYFREVYSVVVLVMPADKEVKENRDLLGFISSSLVEGKGFLNTIFDGEEAEIRGFLANELKKYFNQYLNQV